MAIDLRPGGKDYNVTTKVLRDGTWYMGPEVVVTARNEVHAEDVARSNGHVPNENFPPKLIKKW